MKLIATTQPAYVTESIEVELRIYEDDRRAAAEAGFDLMDYLTTILARHDLLAGYVCLRTYGWSATSSEADTVTGTVNFTGTRRASTASVFPDQFGEHVSLIPNLGVTAEEFIGAFKEQR